MQNKNYDKSDIFHTRPEKLSDLFEFETIILYGMGRNGMLCYEKLKGFGGNVILWDNNPDTYNNIKISLPPDDFDILDNYGNYIIVITPSINVYAEQILTSIPKGKKVAVLSEFQDFHEVCEIPIFEIQGLKKTPGTNTRVGLAGMYNIDCKYTDDYILKQNWIGDNVGNLFFSNAVYTHLSLNTGNEIVSWGTRECDHLVFPMANSLANYAKESLKKITLFLKNNESPCTITGIGGDSPNLGDWEMYEYPDNREIVIDFVKAVLSKSESMGVRGSLTKDLLVNNYGFDKAKIDIIGCPSLFYYGKFFSKHIKRNPFVEKKLLRINTSISGGMPHQLDAFFNHIWNEYQNSRVTFTDKQEGEFLWYDKPIPGASESLPFNKNHFMIQQNRCDFFVKFNKTIDHLRNFDFSIGIRLHGTIAAILAGVPAMLIVYGPRPLEVAQYANIPFVKYEEVGKFSVEELYEKALCGMQKYYRTYDENISRYADFLKRNNVPVNMKYLLD